MASDFQPGSPPPTSETASPTGPLPVRQPVAAAHDPHGQARFQAAFEHSPLSLLLLDVNLIIRQANPVFGALLGFNPAHDMPGRIMLDFVPSAHHADWHRLQQQQHTCHPPRITLETCLVAHDESLVCCQLTAVLLPDDGTGATGFVTLEPLQPSARLLPETQETLRHAIAHDLRTPLATIQLLVDLLQRLAAQPGPNAAEDQDKTAQYVALIQQCCAEANVRIQDVLRLLEQPAS